MGAGRNALGKRREDIMSNTTLKIASYYTTEADRIVNDEKSPRFYFSGVYLHGEIECECGYDICYPLNPEDFPGCVRDILHHFNSGDVIYPYLFLDGIYPCIVDGMYKCTAFLWYDKDAVERGSGSPCLQRGLIVLNTDKDAYEDAQKKYEKRAICL